MDLIGAFLSPEKRAARYADRLERALLAGDQEKVAAWFRKSFDTMLSHGLAQPLADLVLTYGPQVEAMFPLETAVPARSLRQAIAALDENNLEAAAVRICQSCGDEREAIEIMAKRGRANRLAALMTSENLDPELLAVAVRSWERHNGDIRRNPTMGQMLTSIGRFAPASLPANPRVKEIVGQVEEAAVLYAEEGEDRDAARCFEQAERYAEALDLYKRLGDHEAASRVAEAMGDLEEALRLVVNPERRFHLLLQLERFAEAREFAAGLETPDRYFELVNARARERMEIKIEAQDFLAAIELADVAGSEIAELEGLIALGQRYFEKRLRAATTKEEMRAIVLDRVDFEERAGNFQEAGRLAEEVLQDLDRASLLYEKANLFHKAIGTASGLIRIAELHEKGGNHLRAAELYESAGEYDKAFALYESIQHFQKALECYYKTANLRQDVLIRLHTGAGDFGKVVELYMESASFPDLEKALAIATRHGLASHVRAIEARMEEWISGNRRDLVRAYAEARAHVEGLYTPVLGIDFGTTNSVVALFNRESEQVETVPDARGMAHQPSYFGVDEKGQIIFGEAARLRSLTAPDCAVARVKRSLGQRVTFTVHGKRYRCEQVVASLLQHLQSQAMGYLQSRVEARFHELLESRNLRFPAQSLRAFLNTQERLVPVKDVVLSVPAYFNDNQKRATRDSAEVAGLSVRRLLHEPTAAALAYSYQKPYSGTLAVVDLGGGTLDISILDIGEGVNDVLTVGGDTQLGGSDIDAILVQRVIEDIKERLGIDVDEEVHRSEITRLRDACENLKINLSSVTQYTMELVRFMNQPHYTFTLTREELERFSKPILDRFQATINRTVAGFKGEIDHYILVGNATKMPVVQALAQSTIRARELRRIDPGTVVARGAALEGAILSGDTAQTLLLDIVPYSLGIVVAPKEGGEQISRLIQKDTTIPTVNSEIFTTKEDNQPNVHIRVFQGEFAEPHRNHFLGDFVLDVPPAPAHMPQIEVTFDIGADCILNVTAIDKDTGKERSIRIEGSVVLSPQEKEDLRSLFAQKEKGHSLERELQELRLEIDRVRRSCEEQICAAEQAIQDFFVQFHEKIEINPQLYSVDPDKIRAIQEMIIDKDRFVHGIPGYRDQLASALRNLREVEAWHLDFSARDILRRLRDRMDRLVRCRQAFVELEASVEKNVTSLLADWMQILDAMEPDTERMTTLEAANYHLTVGQARRAREILESLASGEEALSEEAFYLLLKCYVSLGLRDEYRDTHRRFGALFGLVHPDFSRLNMYLQAVDDSVFVIQGALRQGASTGSGFCIAPNLVVTNRHVVEGMTAERVRIVGKQGAIAVEHVELDPINDIAVLRTGEKLQPLRLGEFRFVEPGEQVLAVGYPSLDSTDYGENIYVSTGIVNAIRRSKSSSERVIFVDTKIGGGMSGGPLINGLGEVVGIITGAQVEARQIQNRIVPVADQPLALPIYLVEKYL
jgi:molecular chaperone DnaK